MSTELAIDKWDKCMFVLSETGNYYIVTLVGKIRKWIEINTSPLHVDKSKTIEINQQQSFAFLKFRLIKYF